MAGCVLDVKLITEPTTGPDIRGSQPRIELVGESEEVAEGSRLESGENKKSFKIYVCVELFWSALQCPQSMSRLIIIASHWP